MSEQKYQRVQPQVNIGNIKYLDPASKQDHQSRQQLLQRVKTAVTQSLRLSLQESVPIRLKLRSRADLIESTRIWRKSQTANLEVSILQSYEDADGDLLILGESGAGKTILIEELTRQLIERAEQNELALIPIIFNLASWAAKRLTLEEWLIEELAHRYHVPLEVGRRLIEEDQVRLLLDGLDETRESAQEACVRAINFYKANHMIPVTVCGCTTEYLKAGVKLRLQEAFIVQPLSPHQVQEALLQAGKQFAAIHAALYIDTILQQSLSTPLMLYVIINAYRSQSTLINLGTLTGNAKERKDQLWSKYVENMFECWNRERQKDRPRYNARSVKSGLAWLAWQMKQHDLAEAYPERMQADWFSPVRLRWFPRFVRVGPIRFLLWGSKVTSGSYVRFLNYADQLHLLRNIGGRYLFIHHELLEYFARQYGIPLSQSPLPPPTISMKQHDMTQLISPLQSRPCPTCRYALPIDAKFCGRCGSKL